MSEQPALIPTSGVQNASDIEPIHGVPSPNYPLLRNLTIGALLGWCSLAAAQSATLPTAQEWAQWSPEQRTQRQGEIREQLKRASPEERKAFREMIRTEIATMSPEQRQALVGKAKAKWQAMSPDERQKIIEERRQRIKNMSPEERKAIQDLRKSALEKLTPEERAAMLTPLRLR